jgi:hypothetical protein
MWIALILSISIISLVGMSIPILGILRSKPQNPQLEEAFKKLEERVAQLEGESAAKTLELDSLRKELAFNTKLLSER